MEVAEFEALVNRLSGDPGQNAGSADGLDGASPLSQRGASMPGRAAAYPPEGITTPGEWLRALRAVRRWSRRDLSRQIGVNRHVIARWESGEAPLRRQRVIAHLNAIAAQLGLPLCPELEPQPRRTRDGDRPRRRNSLKRPTPRSASRL